jgi:cytochrome c oxidase subunit IV
MTTASAHEGGHAHPSDMEYVKVALVLAAITGAEVAMPYVTDVKGPILALMLVLMVTKFTIVAMWFMHLRFDSLLFRRFFVTGLVLATLVYLAVFTSTQFFGKDTTSLPLDERPAPARIRF